MLGGFGTRGDVGDDGFRVRERGKIACNLALNAPIVLCLVSAPSLNLNTLARVRYSNVLSRLGICV